MSGHLQSTTSSLMWIPSFFPFVIDRVSFRMASKFELLLAVFRRDVEFLQVHGSGTA